MGKRKILPLIAFFLTCVCINTSKIHASAYVLYEKITKEELSKGVEFIKKEQVTNAGLRDVFILRAPLKDEFIKIDNIISNKEHHLKETTSELVNSNNAIAGVNGDFFAMAGTHSITQGPVVSGGEVVTIDKLNNLYKNEYATLVVSQDGTPILDYIKADIDFLNNGVENINVFSVNKVQELIYPTYVDTKAMSDTSKIDAKFKGVLKIVVENDVITYISQKGELVKIPENGYVILLNSESADHQSTLVKVGDKAEIKIKSAVDFDSVYSAMGGGGKLLSAGNVVNDAGFVAKGRQPRTAIGVSTDKSEVIIMVVDGRSHSIGATHDELAGLMLANGASEAMHLDGGGSTTMAVKTTEEDNASVVNTPSQSVQRKVANVVGIYNKSATGAISKIVFNVKTDEIIQGTGIPCNVYGTDEYLNKIDLEAEKLEISSSDEQGTFSNGYFYPSKTGDIVLTAKYGEITTEKKIRSTTLLELIPETDKLKTEVGTKTLLGFNGKTVEGITRYIYDGIKFEVSPATIGTIENNNFVAKENGVGYIKASVGEVVYYLDVVIGSKIIQLNSFENNEPIGFSSYPAEGISGNLLYTSENVKDGNKSIEFKYKFAKTDVTQAAYLNFENKMKIDSTANKLKLDVFGDNSNNLLKARALDSNGKEFLLTLANEINWTDYKTLSIPLPRDAKYPLYLERIYVASLANDNTNERKIYFDNLGLEVSLGESISHPANSKFYDAKYTTIDPNTVADNYDITIVGNMNSPASKKPANYVELQDKALSPFVKSSSLGIFAGNSDYQNQLSIPTKKWGNQYAFYEHNNTGIMYMTSSKGSYYGSNQEQWINFAKDIRNRNKDHIVIITDLNPIKRLTNKEFMLMHEALRDLKLEGKNIFVVSTDGNNNTTQVMDGIRYVNLAGLFKTDGTLNQDFKYGRFRINCNEITYELKNSF